MSKPTLTVTKNFTQRFNDIVKKFRHDEVLVGIPQETSQRQGSEPINNATLFAIANFGSPLNNIPAWPIMAIGIRNARKEIGEQFKKAAIKALKDGFSAIDTYYERAGIIASTSIKKVINDQEDVPDGKPEDSTLAARKVTGFKGTKYWLVTAQMRNSITYVIRGER